MAEPQPTAVDPPYQPLTRWERFCRTAVARRLGKLQSGRLRLMDSVGEQHFAAARQGAADLDAQIDVHDGRLYSAVVLGGSLGAAESYLCGHWSSPDLVSALRLFARNLTTVTHMDRFGSRLQTPSRAAWRWLRRNTRAGSRRNIAAHYDLSNEFFALMLDRTMTYSSGWFDGATTSLQQASLAKYERICRKLDLQPSDHVVEIGTGWGGFALHAAARFGCQVTTTTISKQQHALAQQRVRDAGLQHRVRVLLEDYRDLTGAYDKLVSIEMIEAVGEQHLDGYFRQCNQLLKPGGSMALQVITMPDHRYDEYRSGVDFINRYIFPGGFLPSFSAIGQSLRRGTDFRVVHAEDFAGDYARTLSLWRANFWRNIEQVRRLGFDDRFIRMWHYYLCYCEAGFVEDQIGVSQIVLSRPAADRGKVRC